MNVWVVLIESPVVSDIFGVYNTREDAKMRFSIKSNTMPDWDEDENTSTAVVNNFVVTVECYEVR